jgi:GST-like protein
MTAPIELYYWPTPNGWKISIMLEELGVPYKVKYINIGRGEQFAPEFLKIAPNNRMPAIIDPDGPGGEPISVFESGAVLQYLGRKFGKFYSAEERTRIQIEEWLSGRWVDWVRWLARRITSAAMRRRRSSTASIAIPTK